MSSHGIHGRTRKNKYLIPVVPIFSRLHDQVLATEPFMTVAAGTRGIISLIFLSVFFRGFRGH
jgi:hypothetical protein